MDKFAVRQYILGAICVLVGLAYIARLFYIQVIDESYILSSFNNSSRYVVKHPARGLIYDRNGKLIVYNEAAYDLMVIPKQVESFDTAHLEHILGISHDDFLKRLQKAKDYSSRRPSEFLGQVSAETYSYFQERMHRFPGFFVQSRTHRKYPYKSAAHILGYIREVSKKVIDKDPYYKSGDYIGVKGLESVYEEALRGQKGGEYFEVDVYGRVKKRLEEGKYDTLAVVGKNLTTTIDIDLQVFGETLMKGKKGSIVALEPETGEILCLVSSPTYDPNLLVGRALSDNYKSLSTDSLRPLYNRAANAFYPPGSTFKPINALIGCQEKIITQWTRFGCNNGFQAGGLRVGCHPHIGPLDMPHSVMHSCNAYYCHTFRNLIDNPKYGDRETAYNVWRKHVTSFGFGSRLETDLASEHPGKVPQTTYYDKIYGRGRWKGLTIISMSIGQGELAMTPLHMANSTAVIANRGYYRIPHLVKKIGEEEIDNKYVMKHYATIDTAYYEPVIEGMDMVVQGGPGATARFSKIPDLVMCGKTGTAQNPHGKDHSIFVAFAPRENPQIAIAVYVENAGYGSTWAAPIASMMVEKYLKDTVSKPQWIVDRIMNTDLIHGQP